MRLTGYLLRAPTNGNSLKLLSALANYVRIRSVVVVVVFLLCFLIRNVSTSNVYLHFL